MSDDGLDDWLRQNAGIDTMLDHPGEKQIVAWLRELQDARAEIARLRKRPSIETGEPPTDGTVVYAIEKIESYPLRYTVNEWQQKSRFSGLWFVIRSHHPPALWTREPIGGE